KKPVENNSSEAPKKTFFVKKEDVVAKQEAPKKFTPKGDFKKDNNFGSITNCSDYYLAMDFFASDGNSTRSRRSICSSY
ncbi:MAG TPA: hypothetical protein PLJ02_01775, partial [Candidatus Woesebacteria bacterium]|nr:hypothetical protein [Candidatus Woesebacteria bacterium]